MKQVYIIDQINIMHDTVDGEVVIVNMNNGFYYNSDKLGAQIWQMVATGHSVESIIAQLKDRYPDHSAQVVSEVQAFLDHLLTEGLVEPGEETGSAEAVTFPHIPYATPTLEKYTDMDQLLLLDPIHEVEETGWPHTN
ncbi:PqqD family protein [Pseudomonadota bacterium]